MGWLSFKFGTLSGWELLLVLGLGFFWLRWLWPYLKGWKAPVLAYGVVMSLMLWVGPGTGRVEIVLGALLFYLSDFFASRQRFVVQQPLNPLLGLPLYYAAQYLLAWAVR